MLSDESLVHSTYLTLRCWRHYPSHWASSPPPRTWSSSNPRHQPGPIQRHSATQETCAWRSAPSRRRPRSHNCSSPWCTPAPCAGRTWSDRRGQTSSCSRHTWENLQGSGLRLKLGSLIWFVFVIYLNVLKEIFEGKVFGRRATPGNILSCGPGILIWTFCRFTQPLFSFLSFGATAVCATSQE